MNTKWIKVGVGAAVALVVVAGLSFGAVTNAQAQSSWFSQPNGQITFAAWPGGPGGMGMGMRGQGGSFATIAKALGMNETDLLTELRSGKSVADVAKEKNVDLSKVVDAIVAERTDQLKQAVTNGRITQQQADAMIAKMKTDLPTTLSNKFPTGQKGFGPGRQPGGMMGRGMMSRGMMGFGGSPATIAQTLGISETNLLTELQSGKSVADVAQEKNVDLNKVVDALVSEATTHLKQAVTDGRLTQAQADQMIATLKANLPHLLSLKHNPGGMMGPGHRFGGRRFGQPGTQNQAPAQGGTQQSDNPGNLWESAQST